MLAVNRSSLSSAWWLGLICNQIWWFWLGYWAFHTLLWSWGFGSLWFQTEILCKNLPAKWENHSLGVKLAIRHQNLSLVSLLRWNRHSEGVIQVLTVWRSMISFLKWRWISVLIWSFSNVIHSLCRHDLSRLSVNPSHAFALRLGLMDWGGFDLSGADHDFLWLSFRINYFWAVVFLMGLWKLISRAGDCPPSCLSSRLWWRRRLLPSSHGFGWF